MIVILDSSALLAGFHPVPNYSYYVTTEVMAEIKNENRKLQLQIGIDNGDIQLFHPKEEFLDEVTKKLESLGESSALSDADISILASALEFKNRGIDVEIATDDYGIQNICRHLSIRYTSFREKGISKKLEWIFLCRGCGRIYAQKHESCDVCGSPIRRRPKRRT